MSTATEGNGRGYASGGYEIGEKQGTGLPCPECGESKMIVLDSRPKKDGRERWRRRECPECGHRVTTTEELAPGRNGGRKHVDHRTLEIADELEERFARRLERMCYDHDDPGLVAKALAEAAMEEYGALCEEIVEDPEGWVP